MKLGRFIVDTHVHPQRFAAGAGLKERVSQAYADLGEIMVTSEPYDNSRRLLYDMDCYQVDMCVIQPFPFSPWNELNIKMMEKYPDKFVCTCLPEQTFRKALRGEIEWTIDGVCEELESLLQTGKFVGIGESMPYQPNLLRRGFKPVSEMERMEQMGKVMDLARKYKVVAQYHGGTNMGYLAAYHAAPERFNPLWCHDLAVAYPDVPIVIGHGGMQQWWWEHFVDGALHVAASHKNVYLETGYWWTDLYYKALNDPNIGAEQLLWGTDWGASIPIYAQPGKYPPSYAVQLEKEGVVRHQVDVWGWSLRQLARLEMSQDDLNLILGGNAVRIYHLKVPHTRLFKV